MDTIHLESWPVIDELLTIAALIKSGHAVKRSEIEEAFEIIDNNIPVRMWLEKYEPHALKVLEGKRCQ